jgi:gas vesicle protein
VDIATHLFPGNEANGPERPVVTWHHFLSWQISSQDVSRNNQNDNVMNARNLISGLMIGAVLGAAAGLLLAPASGEKTRKKLVKSSEKLKNNVKDYVEGSVGALRDQFNEKIDQLARRGKESINHVSERVKV